jgi:transcriptional regulator with XRE-family HTH domain
MSHRLNAENLRLAAARAGDLTDYRIAKRSGVPRATLSRLVNGQGEPTISSLMLLATCYRVSIESLVRKAEAATAAAA